MTEKEISSSEIYLESSPGDTLLEALERKGIFPEGGCMGMGHCGRCRVRYFAGAPLPDAAERRFLSPAELREGVRLACMHRLMDSCRVTVEFPHTKPPEIVSKTALSETGAVRHGGGEAAGTDEEDGCAAWRIAIDLGTTTVAMQARASADGRLLAEWKGLNPQRRFGSDVISRIQAARSGRAKELRQCAESMLTEGIESLTAACGAKTGCGMTGAGLPEKICLAGNTAMEHLLAGLSVEGLSAHPFTPVTLGEQNVRLRGRNTWYDVTLMPGLSAFVGADILAGILASGMHRRGEIGLLIDLGTNGELVLGNRDRMLCTATAAGPAFEGRTGTEGTDVIAVIGELLDAGIVDETGLLAEPWFTSGVGWNPAGQPGKTVHITQEDIRAVQMAKAAVFSGIHLLARAYGIGLEKIEHVWLAGGFGYCLDVNRAAQIGLLPTSLAGRAKAVGNTSLAGAFLYGAEGGAEQANAIRAVCEPLNLAGQEAFGAFYLSHLNFEKEDGSI